MATIKMTNSELAQFRSTAQMFINRHPDRSRLHYALEKTIKKTQNLFDEYMDDENEIRMDCALIGPDKKFLFLDDKKSLAVDPAKGKDMQNRLRKLGNKEVEFEPCFTTEFDPNLEAGWLQFFIGVVIKEEDDPLNKKMSEGKPSANGIDKQLEKVND